MSEIIDRVITAIKANRSKYKNNEDPEVREVARRLAKGALTRPDRLRNEDNILFMSMTEVGFMTEAEISGGF